MLSVVCTLSRTNLIHLWNGARAMARCGVPSWVSMRLYIVSPPSHQQTIQISMHVAMHAHTHHHHVMADILASTGWPGLAWQWVGHHTGHIVATAARVRMGIPLRNNYIIRTFSIYFFHSFFLLLSRLIISVLNDERGAKGSGAGGWMMPSGRMLK